MRVRVIAALVVMVAGIAAAFALTSALPKPSVNDGPSLAQVSRMMQYDPDRVRRAASRLGVGREPDPKDEVHEHVALRVFVDGSELHLPREFGYVDAGRPLAVHTHDSSGVVHLHRPRDGQPFTVAQMLGVSGLPVTDGKVGPWETAAADGSPVVRLWVNGRTVRIDPNRRLRDRDDLVLQLGGEASSPQKPSAFVWAASALDAS